jgi:DNA-binding NarL/FixJ family response regulator
VELSKTRRGGVVPRSQAATGKAGPFSWHCLRPANQQREAIVEGTRVPRKIILVDLSQGLSIQEISEEYDLTEEQVKNALNYPAALVP